MLSYSYFRTLGKRKDALRERLYRKYAKYLKLPDWGDDEIEELGYTLGTFIRAGQEKKRLTTKRLAW